MCFKNADAKICQSSKTSKNLENIYLIVQQID